MSLDHLVQAVEQAVLCRKLNLSEQKVLVHSFQGHSYDTMARDSSYAKGYLKVIGSRLWKELSDALQQRVNKKNVYAVLIAYTKNQQTLSSQSLADSSRQQTPQAAQRSSTANKYVASDATPQYSPLAGPLPLDSPFYIERLPLDSRAYQEIERPGCLLRLKAPRRYGKSSLLLRLTSHATALGFRSVLIDFQDAEHATLNDIERLLRWFCANIAQQLQLRTNLTGVDSDDVNSNKIDLNEVWNPDLGSKLNCKAFLQEQVLTPNSAPVLLVLNEVNYIFEYPAVARDFLPFVRSCYEQAQRSAQWERLRWVMAYSTEVYVSLSLNQSPFNVGIPLILPPFNLDQTRDLAQRYGLQSLTPQQVSQLMSLLGGKPYLLNLAFHALSVQKVPWDLFFKTAPTLSGIYKTHLQRYLTLLIDQPDLITALETLLSSEQSVQIDPTAAYKLASVGLVSLEGYKTHMSCRLYRDYFKEVLYSESGTTE
ncbi:MAG: AAA-like domain-containing protein [Cyanobacteria bacterium P01_D01_bin.105]